MRRLPLLLSLLVVACNPPAAAPSPAVPASAQAAAPATVRNASEQESLARAALDRGVLDIAAEHFRLASLAAPSAESRLALAQVQFDGWAYEAAQATLTQLQNDPAAPQTVQSKARALLSSIPGDLAPSEADPALVDRVLRSLASRDAKSARTILAPALGPSSAPLLLDLAGRATWMLGDQVEARKIWSRARNRLDANREKIGMLATQAAAVARLHWSEGRLSLARMRERYLIGGYQSNRTRTEWIEHYAPGDAEPLVRWPTGNLRAAAFSPEGRYIALVDSPPEKTFAPVSTVAKVLDGRTGKELARWGGGNVNLLSFGPGPDSLIAGLEQTVEVLDLTGRVKRTLALSGTTPGVVRVYRAPGAAHDNRPINYQTAPVTIDSSPTGTIAVGATDGSIWVWRPGSQTPVKLVAGKAPLDDREAFQRRPAAIQLDPKGSSLLVALENGAVLRWDLQQRASRIVVEPRCSERELQGSMYGLTPGAPVPPGVLANCAVVRLAAFSPDLSRMLLAGGLGGGRVRGKDGAPLSVLDTLSSESVVFPDPSGTRLWLGGMDGSVDQWDTTAGQRLGPLAQGGVQGFLRGVSSDGRFLAIGTEVEGFRNQSKPYVRVYDTAAGRTVEGLPRDLVWASFASDRPVLFAITEAPEAQLWDLATGTRLAAFEAKEQGLVGLSARGDRMVLLQGHKTLLLRDAQAVLKEIDLGGQVWGVAVDRTASTVATAMEANEVVVWNLVEGRERLRRSALNAGPVALSPEGKLLAFHSDAKTLNVLSLDDKREVATLTTHDLSPDKDYMPIRASAFLNENEMLVVGPAGPGYELVYRWTFGQKPEPTELQVLGTDSIRLGANGVATVFDRNDTAHLLRAADGVLLASVYATRGTGWVAQSREGAVDGSAEGRSALLTVLGASPERAAYSSWLGWDRFAVPGLLLRAAAGQQVIPLLPGVTARTDTLGGNAKDSKPRSKH